MEETARRRQDGGERQQRRRDDGRQRRQPLAAAAPLGDKDGVEEVMAAWEEENSWSWESFTT